MTTRGTMTVVLAATQTLLDSLDPLSHRARMRRLAQWARTAHERSAVCADLRTAGPYERRLALIAAMVAGDHEGITAAVQDPLPGVRSAALAAALRAGLLPGRVAQLSAHERRRAYRALRGLAAAELADALIDEVRSHFGDDEAAALLPACGAATVRALLPELEHAANLAAVARRHPAPVLALAGQRLAATAPGDWPREWWRYAGALSACDPAGVLEVIEQWSPADWLPHDLAGFAALAAHDARRVVRLLTAAARVGRVHGSHLPPALLRRLARLPDDDLLPLLRAVRRYPSHFVPLLGAVAPARRGALYGRTFADVPARLPFVAVMDLLPVADRIGEARRALRLAEVRAQEAQVRHWSAYLAWPQAAAAVGPGLRSGDAGQRAQAYALLLHAARRTRDPQVVAEVVERLDRLRNEADPVRATAMFALESCAPLLSPAAAPALTRLTAGTLEARDTSRGAVASLSLLATATLRHHVDEPVLREWALHTLERISGETARPALCRLDRVLRRGQEALVVDRLAGTVAAAMDGGRYGPLFALVGALGGRARRLPAVQRMLRRAIGPDTPADVARQAIERWLDDPRGRDERVGEVLAADPTAVDVPRVWAVLCRSRTDLLDGALRGSPHGRLIEPGTSWLPGPALHSDRWLPRHQAAYVALLARVADDAGQPVRARARALRTAAPVAGPGRELVLRHLGATDVVVAEAALGALARTDRPDEALAELLGYAGGDRARVAAYAAARAAGHVAPARLPALLGGVLAGPARVTSRKEAARLLGRYASAGVLTTLHEVYADPATHRDVRAAIVSAARRRLDAEPAWQVLTAARDGSREERLAVLAAGPGAMARSHRPRYAELVADACRSADREVRRGGFAVLSVWSPWLPAAAGDLVAGRLADLDEPVLPGDVARLLRPLGVARLAGVLAGLVDRDAADDRPGEAGRDRPARRRVETLVAGVDTWAAGPHAEADRAPLLDAARWLAARDGYRGAGVAMVAALARLPELDELADLCAGRPVLAVRTAEGVPARVRRLPIHPDDTLVTRAAAHLAARGDLAGGLFAVALLRDGAAAGPEPLRAVLRDLRRHREPEVRDEAYAVDLS